MKKITLLLATMLIGIMTYAQTIAMFKSQSVELKNGEMYALPTTIEVYESENGKRFISETINVNKKIVSLCMVKSERVEDKGIYVVEAVDETGLEYRYYFSEHFAILSFPGTKCTYRGKMIIKNF